jgi:Cysteine dioxygenase type I
MRYPARWHPTPRAGALRSSRRPTGVDPREVASRLVPAVHWPGALDREERTWRLVARTPDFDAWLVAWPSGGRVDIHDHGISRGAVSVISGALVEAVPRRDDSGRLSWVQRELRAGATVGFGTGHVHDVTNESDVHALSLHVYSPALTAMTFYDVEGDQLLVRGLEWADDGCGESELDLHFGIAEVEAASR